MKTGYRLTIPNTIRPYGGKTTSAPAKSVEIFRINTFGNMHVILDEKYERNMGPKLKSYGRF